MAKKIEGYIKLQIPAGKAVLGPCPGEPIIPREKRKFRLNR